jgi:hypothetical protein
MTDERIDYRHATPEQKRATLGEGPWVDEPNYIEWAGTGATRGLVHIVLRGPWGSTCGYVGVPPGHPWHGKDYREIDARVHGGITYAAPCNDHVCHVPAPGEPESLWWVGFDCGHAFDYIPGRGAYVEPGPTAGPWVDRYRSMDYAKEEASRLAWQAAKERRWVEHRAAQPSTRHASHKVEAGIVLELRVVQRARSRQRRKRMVVCS